MEKYESLQLEVIAFENEDIITGSGNIPTYVSGGDGTDIPSIGTGN